MMRARVRLFVLAALLALAGLFAACQPLSIAEEREQRALNATASDPIIVGIAFPLSDPAFIKFTWGVNMAVEELNSAGGVLGRQIELIRQDDGRDITQGRLVAQRLADNPDVVAVIGHYNSFISLPASATYQFSGLLMLSPGSTNPALTRQGFDLVFRNVPTDTEVGRQMARYALSAGYRRMVILYANDSYGRGLGNVFELEAQNLSITIVDRRSFVGGQSSFAEIVSALKRQDFDAVFFAGLAAEAHTFLHEAHEAGINVPLMGGDGLDSPELFGIDPEIADGTIVASFFHPALPSAQAFNERFAADFQGQLPDTWAAQGYDAVHLLAYAMEQAGSTAPHAVAAALHTIDAWEGVTGTHTFDANGDVVGKPVVLMIARNGVFEFLQVVGAVN